MKKPFTGISLLTIVATLTLCVFTVAAGQQGTRTARAEDEAAIRENVKQMEAGWNTKSGSLFAKPFAEDADYVVINGMYFQGRDAIEKVHQQIFDTIFKNTTVSLHVKQIRFLRPDIAVVHVAGHKDAGENERHLVSDAMVSMIMTKDKGAWKIRVSEHADNRQPVALDGRSARDDP